MFCRNCGKEVTDNAIACMGCGCDPRKGSRFCPNCGTEVNANQIVCTKCGVSLDGRAAPRSTGVSGTPGAKNRVTAGILALLLGAFGAHEFYLGNTTSAIIRLVVSLVGFFVLGVGTIVMSIIALVEGIMFLTKSDDEFQRIYIDGKKAWF